MEKYITIREAKTYIDNNLNSTKVNVDIDPTKDNITRSLGVKEILDELQISKMIITELCQYQKMKI